MAHRGSARKTHRTGTSRRNQGRSPFERLPWPAYEEILQNLDFKSFMNVISSSKHLRKKCVDSHFKFELKVEVLTVLECAKMNPTDQARLFWFVRAPNHFQNAIPLIKFDPNAVKLDVAYLQIAVLDIRNFPNIYNEIKLFQVKIGVVDFNISTPSYTVPRPDELTLCVQELSPKGLRVFAGREIFQVQGITEMTTLLTKNLTCTDEEFLSLKASVLTFLQCRLSHTAIFKLLQEWADEERELIAAIFDGLWDFGYVEFGMLMRNSSFVEDVSPVFRIQSRSGKTGTVEFHTVGNCLRLHIEITGGQIHLSMDL